MECGCISVWQGLGVSRVGVLEVSRDLASMGVN